MKTMQRYEHRHAHPSFVQVDWGPVCKVEDIRAVFERLRKVETREAMLRILDEEQP